MSESTKHPEGLMTLFFSEMWERFCYYGMRVLLTLYLVKSLMKGDSEAALIYGAYTGLVYTAPILGGRMADKYLGYRLAVMFGAVLMAIGEFIILGGTDEFLLLGMGAIIIGNGYFKANISTIVGKLYEDGDPRRDSGFTIFYIGINIGALLATTIVAYVGETYGFDKGFALAGFGMLLGLFIFWSGRAKYQIASGVDETEEGKKKLFGPFKKTHAVIILSILIIPLGYVLILNNQYLNYIFLGLFIYIVFTLIYAGANEDKKTGDGVWRDRMIALSIFMVINSVFWACFEQAGTSLTLFADRNVDREILGWEMPASMTQFFNPFFIILFGSLFSLMWVKLAKIGKNPNIPMKFSFGILQLGLGFLITYAGYQFTQNNMVPLITLVLLYMLHTTGELFLSPIGLSMVTKLSPRKMAGTAMGAWFLSFAMGNLLGGQIAALTGAESKPVLESKDKLSMSLTLEEAFGNIAQESISYESWQPLSEDMAKNITYQKWFDIQDWVDMREALDQDFTLKDWAERRALVDTFATASQWLDQEKWQSLGEKYEQYISEEENGMSLEDWLYYRADLENIEAGESTTLAAALEKQIDKVQNQRLDKYIDIFTKIGLVLLGISLIIALVNKLIQKLMHGVV